MTYKCDSSIKRIIVGFVVIILQLMSTLYTLANETKTDADVSTICFDGVAASMEEGRNVSLTVYKGHDYDSENSDNIILVEQGLTKAGGNFSFEVPTGELPAVYTAKVKVAGEYKTRVYESETELLQEDFSEYEGGLDDEWIHYFTPASMYTREEVDLEHGVSLGLKDYDVASPAVGFRFNSNVSKEDVIIIKFSARVDSGDSLLYTRLIDDEWTKYNSENDSHMYETFWMGDNEIGLFVASQGWVQNSILECEEKKWYDVEIWLDNRHKKIFYVIKSENGIVCEETTIVPESEICGMLFNYEGTEKAYIDNVNVEYVDWEIVEQRKQTGEYIPEILNNPVEAYVESENTGNIFWDEQEAKLNINLKNVSDTEQNVDFKVKISDIYKNTVWEKTEMITVKQERDLVYYPEITAFGVYNIDIYNSDDRIGGGSLSRVVSNNTTNSKLGIGTHFDRKYGDAETLLTLIEKAGIGNTRDVFPIKEIEQGVYSNDFYVNDPQFSVYINESLNKDIGMYGVIYINYGSTLYEEDEDGGFNTTDEYLNGLTSYCEWLAGEFKGKVDYFEIGNEVQFIYNNDGTVASGVDYAKILKAAYNGLKAGNPNVNVVAFASASVGDAKTQMIECLDAMKKEGTYYFDAISIHPYHIANPPEVHDRWIYDLDWAGQGTELQNILSGYNLENIEIIGSEFGYHNCVTYNHSEADTASWIIRSLLLNESYDLYDKIFIYEMQNSGNDKNYTEYNFGLLKTWQGEETPYGAKVIYPALSFYNKMLAGAECTHNSENESFYELDFVGNDRKVKVVWDAESSGKKEYNAENRTSYVYDMFGNLIEEIEPNTQKNIEYGMKPIYIVTETENFYATANSKMLNGLEDLNKGDKIQLYYNSDSIENGYFIISTYVNNSFKYVHFVDINEGQAYYEMTYDGDCDSIKLMAFESLINLRPITQYKEIDSGDGGAK